MAKLNEKRAAEAALDASVKERAREDMLGWKTQRDIRLNARKVSWHCYYDIKRMWHNLIHFLYLCDVKGSNRCQEQVLLETLESDVDANNIWDGISKFVDTTNDYVDPKAADISRMKKLLIQLKNSTAESCIAAGK